MGKNLIVAEKPSVAVDIANVIGGGFKKVAQNVFENDAFIVSCAAGHLIELYSPGLASGGQSLEALPVLTLPLSTRVIAQEHVERAFERLSTLMQRPDVTYVINACDAGREGELIFRLIHQHAGCVKPVKRLWLQSMTPDSIRHGLKNLRDSREYDRLGLAAHARSTCDYIVGINGSRGITQLNARKTLNTETMPVGRVLTPTGGILVDREHEIATFKPIPYSELHAIFKCQDGEYVGKWIPPSAKDPSEQDQSNDEGRFRIFDQAKAAEILALCRTAQPSAVEEISKPETKRSPHLYDLSALQRDANQLLKFTAKQTLDIAQSLYEKHKATTYPRTDSRFLPDDYVSAARASVLALCQGSLGNIAQCIVDNNWVQEDRYIFNSEKVTDHFAIIPTEKLPVGLSAEEEKIYDLIARRFLAVFHPAARYDVTTRFTVLADQRFKSLGRVLTEPGWLAVWPKAENTNEKTRLAKVNPGERVSLLKLDKVDRATEPPKRYTEATLLSAMEGAGRFVEDEELRDAMSERGLGTPATRSNIIESLLSDQDRSGRPKEPYVRRRGMDLVPQRKLIELVAFLRSHDIGELASASMTGEWEYKLRQIEKGELTPEEFHVQVNQFTALILEVIKRAAASIAPTYLSASCPKCAGRVRLDVKHYLCDQGCGWLLPRVIASRELKRDEAEELLTNKVIMNLEGFVSKSAKAKHFVACLRLDAEHKAAFFFDEMRDAYDADNELVNCPSCQKHMRRIKGKAGFFWGCSDRENCKTSLPDLNGKAVMPVPSRQCPNCGEKISRFLGKNKKFFWGCSDREVCKTTLEDKDGEPVLPTLLDAKGNPVVCPKCSQGMRRLIRSNGAFWACTDKANCQTTLQDLDGMAVLPKESRSCPQCNVGQISRFLAQSKRFYWSCSDKQTCRALFDDADGEPVLRQTTTCPRCSSSLVRRERKDKTGFFWLCTKYAKDGSGCDGLFKDKNGEPVLVPGNSVKAAVKNNSDSAQQNNRKTRSSDIQPVPLRTDATFE